MKRRKIIPGALRFIAGHLRAIMQPSRFHIKRGYIHRTEVMPHDDHDLQEEYQREVYEAAGVLMKEKDLQQVLDVGCGSGYKLIKYLGEFTTTGVDVTSMIETNRLRYPGRTWISTDDFVPKAHSTDMLICADVIEHVADPREFMESLIQVGEWRYLVISTPERDVKRGWYHFGPPPNVHHYREWNNSEFKRFLSEFVVVEKCSLINKAQGTQMAVCTRKSERQDVYLPHPPAVIHQKPAVHRR